MDPQQLNPMDFGLFDPMAAAMAMSSRGQLPPMLHVQTNAVRADVSFPGYTPKYPPNFECFSTPMAVSSTSEVSSTTLSHPSSLNAPSPSLGGQICLVCEEPGAGKHYGTLCCSGCKGFFRRSIRTKRFYTCSYSNDCLIRKEYRNCCRSCRMNKCLAMGMNPKLVHSDRGAMPNVRRGGSVSGSSNLDGEALKGLQNANCAEEAAASISPATAAAQLARQESSPDLPTDFEYSPPTNAASTAELRPQMDWRVVKPSALLPANVAGRSTSSGFRINVPAAPLQHRSDFWLRNSTEFQNRRDASTFIQTGKRMHDYRPDSVKRRNSINSTEPSPSSSSSSAPSAATPSTPPPDLLADLRAQFSFVKFEGDKLPLGNRALIPRFDAAQPDSVIRFFLTVDQFIDEWSEHDHNHVFTPDHIFHMNADMELMHVFVEPRALMERSRIEWSREYPMSIGALNRIWMRVGMHYIDWMSHVPEIGALSLDDRLRLTADRAMPCIWAMVAQRSATPSTRRGIVLSGGVYYPVDSETEKTMDPMIVKFMGTLTHFLYNEIVEPVQRLGITDAEMCILRVLCLLGSVPGMSEEGRAVIRSAYSFYMGVLYRMLHEELNAPERVAARLCDLMALLPQFEKAASLQDDSFAMLSAMDMHGMGANVIADVHLRKSLRD